MSNTATQPTIQEQHAAIDARAAADKVLNERLAHLLLNVEKLEDALTTAASQRGFLDRRLTELQRLMVSLWGKDKSDLAINEDATASLCACASSQVGIQAALQTFDEAHQSLTNQLDLAKRNLANLQRQAPK